MADIGQQRELVIDIRAIGLSNGGANERHDLACCYFAERSCLWQRDAGRIR